MGAISIILLLFNSFILCMTYSESPRIMFQDKSLDVVTAMQQTAAVLNVPTPGNWQNLMSDASTSGSYGQANVGSSTISSVMANWNIPEQFRTQAVQSVSLLILAATEGEYSAQTFSFDITSVASLTTLLVVAKRISSPVDPNLPVAVMYVTINTNAPLKQLYTQWTERQCHKCAKCAWTKRCCCHDYHYSAPRGHTLAELHIVKQKLTADQFIWFSQQNLLSTASKSSMKSTVSRIHSTYQHVGLTEAIENFLSNKSAKTEVLASYNDSIISAIQSNLTTLKLSSQALKLDRIHKQNVPMILAALSDDYGFDNIYSNPQYFQQLESGRFSYENLFTTETGSGNNCSIIKYVWMLGQVIDNSTYTINLLSLNITSKKLIQTMLMSNASKAISFQQASSIKKLDLLRTSTLSSSGEFFNEYFLTSIVPWDQITARIVLNMLRFLGATVFVPQKFPMLSQFNLEVILPGTYRNNDGSRNSLSISDKVQALTKSISTAISTVGAIIETLKSSKSVTIQRVTRFGFNYFNQKSTVLKAIDIPNSRVNEFINAIILDYNLPSKGSFMLGLTYSDDFAWEQVQYLYSPAMNGNYRSLTLFKNGDSIKNTASFFIVDIDADWALAPDLLLITTKKSRFGGIYSSSKQSIQEVPHVLTLEEAVQLQQFFMLVAIGNMANTMNVNATIPPLN